MNVGLPVERKQKCESCAGTGRLGPIAYPSGKAPVCGRCDGTGLLGVVPTLKQKCERCYGMGLVDVSTGNNPKLRNCTTCQGTGLVQIGNEDHQLPPRKPSATPEQIKAAIDAASETYDDSADELEGILNGYFRYTLELMPDEDIPACANDLLAWRDREIIKLRADIAAAMGHMQGCGHPYKYLQKRYPEFGQDHDEEAKT